MTTTHTTASVSSNEISVTHVNYQGHETIKVAVPNGWDDVQKLVTKALVYEGRKFVYTGWSSDHLEAYFRPGTVATLVNYKR